MGVDEAYWQRLAEREGTDKAFRHLLSRYASTRSALREALDSGFYRRRRRRRRGDACYFWPITTEEASWAFNVPLDVEREPIFWLGRDQLLHPVTLVAGERPVGQKEWLGKLIANSEVVGLAHFQALD